MRNQNLVTVLVILVAFGVMFSSCSNKTNIMSEMTGTWKSDKSSEPVTINLSGEQKSIEIGTAKVPVTVDKVDEGAYSIKMTAKPANGGVAAWSLRQVWNDNGSTFRIIFDHDGDEETLTRS